MLKRLLLILAFAGFLASCSSSKVALETSQDKDVITKDETRYESLSSTLAVEVKDDNTEAVSTTRKAGNTATITVIDCDKELANESESGLESESELESELESESELANNYNNQILLAQEKQDNRFAELGALLSPNKGTKKMPFKGMRKLKSIHKKVKEFPRVKADEAGKKGLDRLVYIILAVLLILLIIRLLEVVVGPIIDVLLLILLIFIIGRILGLW